MIHFLSYDILIPKGKRAERALVPNICPYTPVQDLAEQALTKEQEELVGKGCAGPPVSLDSAPLTNAQVSYVC